MKDRYLMATVAHHKLGDISRDQPDLAHIWDEDGDHWIGKWVEGFGFAPVRFPKDTTRELTAEERRHWAGASVLLGSSLIPLNIDEETR